MTKKCSGHNRKESPHKRSAQPLLDCPYCKGKKGDRRRRYRMAWAYKLHIREHHKLEVQAAQPKERKRTVVISFR